MAEYKVLVTNNGLEKLESAMASGSKLFITHMVFGDAFGEEYIPDANQAALKNQILKKELTERVIDGGQVRYSTAILSSDPSGDFIEAGLILDDGTLFAVANIPKLEHRQATSGALTETTVSIMMVAENSEFITVNISSEIFLTREYGNSSYLRLDGANIVSSDISMGANKITDVKAGTAPADATSVSQLLPIGSIVEYAGVVTPDNWLDCDGASCSRLGDTAALYSVIGTLYGTGTGNLTFNVPKLEPRDAALPLRYIIKYKH